MTDRVEIQHVDYPHEPGYLPDCPACLAKCHCDEGNSLCVWEGHITFDACPDCVDVVSSSLSGAEFTDSQVRHCGKMTDRHPEFMGAFTADILPNVHFSHSACEGCGNVLSGQRMEVTITVRED